MKIMKIMKKLLLTITAVAFATLSFSQQVSRYVVASGGNYSTASGISVSSTIGEPMVTTLTSGSYILTQGFQQSFSAPLASVVINNPLEGENFTTSNNVTVSYRLLILCVNKLLWKDKSILFFL